MSAPLTPADVARQFNVSVRTITRLAERGELAGVRVGNLWRFSTEAVKAFEAAHTAAPVPDAPKATARQPRQQPTAAFDPVGWLPDDYEPVFGNLRRQA